MDAATIFWGKEFNRLISPSFRGNTLEEKSQPAPIDVKNRVPFFGRVSCITAQCSNQISEPSTISSSSLSKFCHWLEITPQFSRNGFSVRRNPALKLRFSAPKINKNDDWDQLPCLSEMFTHFQLRVFELLGLPFPLAVLWGTWFTKQDADMFALYNFVEIQSSSIKCNHRKTPKLSPGGTTFCTSRCCRGRWITQPWTMQGLMPKQ